MLFHHDFPPAKQWHTYFHILNQKLTLEHYNRQEITTTSDNNTQLEKKSEASHFTNFYLASYGKEININLQPFGFKSFLIQDFFLKQQPIPN